MAKPSIFRHKTSDEEIFRKSDRQLPEIQALTAFYPLKDSFKENYCKDEAIIAGEMFFVDNSLQFINGSLSFNNRFSNTEKHRTTSFWILVNEDENEQTIYYEGFKREKQNIIVVLRGKTLIIKSEPTEYDIDFSNYLGKWTHICLYQSEHKIRIFLNGELVDVHILTSVISNLISKFGTDDGSGFPFKGRLKCIRFYNKSLNRYEAKELYNEERVSLIENNFIHDQISIIKNQNISQYKTISYNKNGNENIFEIDGKKLSINNDFILFNNFSVYKIENNFTIQKFEKYLMLFVDGRYVRTIAFENDNYVIKSLVFNKIYVFNNIISVEEIYSLYLVTNADKPHEKELLKTGYNQFGVFSSKRSLYSLGFYEKRHNDYPIAWQLPYLREWNIPGNTYCQADSGIPLLAFDGNHDTQWYSSNEEIHDIKVIFDSEISLDRIEVILGSVGVLEYAISLIYQDLNEDFNVEKEYEIGFQSLLRHENTSDQSIHVYDVGGIVCKGIHLKDMKSVHYYEYWDRDPEQIKYRVALRNILCYGHDKDIYDK